MANTNTALHAANRNKKDEFYTQLSDIEKELSHYREYFKDKIVLCNCDDPYESNFFKYFALNFNALGLKKLMATCYDGSPISGSELPLFFELDENISPKKVAYKVEITEIPDLDGNGATDLSDVQLLLQSDKNIMQPLKGNGDFRSAECVELLKQADIVVTNPPFSLFREYVAQLVKYEKKFLIIGNTGAFSYKEIFPLFKDNKIRTGYTNFNVGMFFYIPDSYEQYHHLENGRKVARVASSCWYTNLPVSKHNEELICIKHYTPEDYPRYDNYDAIDVCPYNDIPCDYDGIMGVPITFLDKLNPEQFEIIGSSSYDDTPCRIDKNYKELGYKFYKSDGVSESGSGALRDKMTPKVRIKGNSDFSVGPNGEILSATYSRVFIRKKQ